MPPVYPETRGTIDPDAARNQNDTPPTTGTIPANIDAPPEYEGRSSQTIEPGEEEKAASNAPDPRRRRRTGKNAPRAAAEASAPESTSADDAEPAITPAEALHRDPTGAAFRENVGNRLDSTADRVPRVQSLAEAFGVAVGDLELDGVVRIGMRVVAEYERLIDDWRALGNDLDVATSVAETLGAGGGPASADAVHEIATLRGRYSALTFKLIDAGAAIAGPVAATTFRHQPVPGVARPSLPVVASPEFATFLNGEVVKTTTLVAVLDELRIRAATLGPDEEPPREVVDLVEMWQGDRAAFLFLHHVLGELGLNAIVGAETRNGKSVADRAGQIARGVPQLAEDIPRTIEEAKAAHDAGDRAAASELLGLAMERMAELGDEGRIREMVAVGGGGGHAVGLQLQAVQLANEWAASAQRELARGEPAKGSLTLAIRAAAAAVPIYRSVSGEASYAESGFANADDFAAMSGATALGMMAAFAAPQVVPALISGGAAALGELAVLAASNPELALEVVMFAASLGLQIGEDGVGAFLDSLKTPEGLLGMVADVLAIRMAAGPTSAPDGSGASRRSTPSGKGDVAARVTDVVDRVQAFVDASVEWVKVKAQPSPVGATPDGPEVRVHDEGPSFGHIYEARVNARRRARVDAGGVTYDPTPEQRRVGYYPPPPDASVASIREQLAAEARALAPHKNAETDEARAAAFKQQVDYFDQVEQHARQEKLRLAEKLKHASPDEAKDLQSRHDAAEKMEAAARVKPVAGALPRSHEYAGGEYGTDDIIRKKVDVNPDLAEEALQEIESRGLTGVQFADDGRPDLEPFIYRENGVVADVTITLTGSRKQDFKAANAKMKEQDPRWRQPPGWTWHHHETEGRMILVPTSVHSVVPHTGGVATYRHRTGDVRAYKDD